LGKLTVRIDMQLVKKIDGHIFGIFVDQTQQSQSEEQNDYALKSLYAGDSA